MIVLDASVVLELLLNGGAADSIKERMVERTGSLIVPHLLDVEVLRALRRLTGSLDSYRSGQLLADLAAFPAVRYPHTPLLNRIWELRNNFTAYDAVYIALAEATQSTLYTCDAKLSKGHRAKIALFSPS